MGSRPNAKPLSTNEGEKDDVDDADDDETFCHTTTAEAARININNVIEGVGVKFLVPPGT